MNIIKYEQYNYDDNNFTEGYPGSKNRKSAAYRAAKSWSQLNRQADLEAQEVRAKTAAIAERTAFLGAAAAIPLFPEIYAGWLVDYLKSGGTVRRTHQKFPQVDPWASPTYQETTIWMITDPQTKATAVPISDHRAPLKIFVGHGQDRFRSQFAMMTATETPPVAKSRLGRRSFATAKTGIEPNTKAASIFGQTAVLMVPTLVTDVSGKEQPVPAFTNQPSAVYLYSDIDQIVRNLTASDRVLQRHLDQIDVYGSSRVTE